VNHNDDIRRLFEKGYALREDQAHLVVRDIPYLDNNLALQVGAIVTKLEDIDGKRVKQGDHQVLFAGSSPYGLDGKPIPNLSDRTAHVALRKSGVTVQRQFSNKPLEAFQDPTKTFPDFFAKIEHYVKLISGPAIDRYGDRAKFLTFRIDEDEAEASVFKFRDTLTSRAEIGDLAQLFNEEVVAVIGLGGTGSYLLDLLVKTPVKSILGFDGDLYHVHNAYRSPGHLEQSELGLSKADVYQSRYENFRNGLRIQRKYVDDTSFPDFEGVTFAFVCVDKGPARSKIFDLLISRRIPFIDVGMGLNRKQGPLAGLLRITYYSAEHAQETRDKQLAEMGDDPSDIYRVVVQTAELNALNACLAVVRYKQLRGFYVNHNDASHFLMGIENLKVFS
jgi:hypothetical protein